MSDNDMDQNVVHLMIDGAVEALKIQYSISAKAGKHMFGHQPLASDVVISAVVIFDSTAFYGSAAVCFSEKVFLGMMEKMLGEKFAAITQDMQDGAAELLNIAFGHAKRILNAKGYDVKKAIPKIVRDADLPNRHENRSIVLVIPFETDVGPFSFEVAT